MSPEDHRMNATYRSNQGNQGSLPTMQETCNHSNQVIAPSVPDIITTDVAIIGNGPSGICLSYMLSGHWPYFNGKHHPNQYLHQRLKEQAELSILEQDLEYLSDGLEGRSSNPVSLLFDALHHPNADLGCSEPTCLEWRYNPRNKIPHVVLGKGLPGGAWQDMKNSKLTLSLRNWMEMPGLSFTEWLQENHQKEVSDDGTDDTRASFSDVSKYYTDFVEAANIKDNFLSHVHVKSVRRIKGRNINCESGENEGFSDVEQAGLENTLFEVICQHGNEGEGQPYDFKIHAKNVVLASGISDLPNKLEVPGENLPFVRYQLNDLEQAIADGEITTSSDPIVVVGAGLSAADVVLYARQKGVPVIHVVRRSVHDQAIILKQLPSAVYPEYHEVYEMMKTGGDPARGYQCYDNSEVTEIQEGKTVVITNAGHSMSIKTSMVMVMIGARPNLSYLCCNGQSLGMNPKQPISKNNPIVTDQYTNESIVSPGIYGMGALVGSNFVRFLTGGALAIVSHLTKYGYLQKMRSED
ncbi:oxidative stress-induced growth inhibitor 1-like [Ptychodera flava]|uniref:oxidative stress-induced growth inhibitor 1-like n=1 Tax=Ptychodera flava TaxID=63121 RepID=UPI00396A3A71